MNSLRVATFLSGLFLTACTIDHPIKSRDKPLLEGRPSLSQCLDIKDKADKIQYTMDRNKKNSDDIKKIEKGYGTLLFQDGCQWLYNSSAGFNKYYADRRHRSENFIRSYADILEENISLKNRLHLKEQTIKEMIEDKVANCDYKDFINTRGGPIYKSGSGSFIPNYNPEKGISLKDSPNFQAE